MREEFDLPTWTYRVRRDLENNGLDLSADELRVFRDVVFTELKYRVMLDYVKSLSLERLADLVRRIDKAGTVRPIYSCVECCDTGVVYSSRFCSCEIGRVGESDGFAAMAKMKRP